MKTPVGARSYGPDGSMCMPVMIGSRSQPVFLPWLSTVIATTGATGIRPFWSATVPSHISDDESEAGCRSSGSTRQST